MYKHLRDLRESLGMTQEEFGNSIGFAKSTYNNYETGIRDPKSDFWIAVAQKYGVTIDYLMGFSDDPHNTGPDVKKSPSAAAAAPGEIHLIELYRELNEEGQERLVETADDMVRSGKYIKSYANQLGKEA